MPTHPATSPQRGDRTLQLLFLLGVVLLLSIGFGAALSWAQTKTPSLPAGPGWQQATAEALSPDQARRTLAGRAQPDSAEATADEAAQTPEIVVLAAALGNDPRLIFDFVYNQIEYVPIFGSANGGQATLLARRGNDWDQTSLFVALMRAAGFAANYQMGDVVYSGDRLAEWTGGQDSTDALNILLNGGVPVEGSSNPAGIKVLRVWAQATVEGQTFLFDPAFKRHRSIAGVDVPQALGYDRATLLAAVQQGATVSGDSVQGLNSPALENHLTGLSSQLVTFVAKNLPTSSLAELIGGREIIPSKLTDLPASLPDALSVTNVTTHSELPDGFHHSLQVQMAGIDRTFRGHEIAGKRISLHFDGPGNAPVVRLEGQALLTGTGTTVGSQQTLTVTIDHPYAAGGGSFGDQTATFRVKSGGAYVLAHSFGLTTKTLIAQRKAIFESLQRAGPGQEQAVLDESLWLIGLLWQHQSLRLGELLEPLADIRLLRHHQAGLIGQEEGYFVDLPLNFSSNVSLSAESRPDAAFRVQTLMGSALEHGILEQLQGSDRPAVSTVALLHASNSQNRKTFRLDSDNLATIKPQLQNYSTSELANIEASATVGRQLILPEDAHIVVNQYRGVGFIDEATADNASSIGMIISGGLFGGFVTEATQVTTETINSGLGSLIQPPIVQGDTYVPLSGDPVDMASGTFDYAYTDIQLGSTGPLGFDFVRRYNSAHNDQSGPLGFGWDHSYHMQLSVTSQSDPLLGQGQASDAAPLVAFAVAALDLLEGERSLLEWMASTLSAQWAMERMIDNLFTVRYGGRTLSFIRRADGSFGSPPGSGLTLQADASGFQLIDRLGQVFFFDTDGRGRGLVDSNNNLLAIVYDGNGRIESITDAFGGALTLTYDGAGRITGITDFGGRTATYSYSNGDLTGYTDFLGNDWRYEYDSQHRMTAYFAPQQPAQPVVRNVYNSLGQVVEQTDVAGNTTHFAYTGSRNVEQQPNGPQITHFFDEQKGLHTAQQDRTGKESTASYNGQNQLTSLTDRTGQSLGLGYHITTGLVSEVVNEEQQPLTFAYASRTQTVTNPLTGQPYPVTFFQLAEVRYADGTVETAEYDGVGNLRRFTNQTGSVWLFDYNDRGQVMKTTNPSGGQILYVYNADGTVASHQDSEVGETFFEYDSLDRITKITEPGGGVSTVEYDNLGRMTGTTDANGNRYQYTYDANGNITAEIDPTGNSTGYTYDAQDRITRLTNDVGGSVQYTYNSFGRLAALTNSFGNGWQFVYNEQGWIVQATDEAGQQWQRAYDDEGLLTQITTPLGRVSRFRYDNRGQVTEMLDPEGGVTRFAYSPVGDPISYTDPLSRTTSYGYDPRGLLAQVDAPGVGTIRYEHNANGSLSKIIDPRQQEWRFDYTPMNRLQRSTDPLGNQWQYEYDNLGRLTKTQYPTGETAEQSFDAVGNLLSHNFSGGLALTYQYDSLYQMKQTDGLRFAHQPGGMVTETVNLPGGGATSFSAAYDKELRVVQVSYDDGAFTVNYTYNSRNLLTKIQDSLTGSSVELFYDNDGRMVEMRRSNGVNTAVTVDGRSQIVGMQDTKSGALVADQQYTLDGANQLVAATLDVPLHPADLPPEQPSGFSYDNAGQINSPGYAYDRRGRRTADPAQTYTWNGANRLVAVSDTQLAYNGLSGVNRRTANGQTTSYHYNYALGPFVVAGERDESSSQWRRFYVWTPGGGMPLYAIDPKQGNSVSFYHYDRMGNTLFLTGGDGAVTDAYAYTPHGKMLGHQGNSDQPYTFAGQFGVRQEGSNALYQMGHRYYDAESGQFLTRDPLWPMTDEVYGVNPYQYANQNPLLYIDPLGLASVGLPLGIFFNSPTFTERTLEDCPLQCKGICKKVEAEKILLVMGDDKGGPVAGHYIRHSYKWARDYLRKKCGKENVIALREPQWGTLKKTIEENKQDIGTFVFIGHGDRDEGLDITDESIQDTVKSNWLLNRSKSSPTFGTTIPNVYLFACLQGTPEHRKNWMNALGAETFMGVDGLLSAIALYHSYISYVEKIPCTTHKWVCVEAADTKQPKPVQSEQQAVSEKVKVHVGRQETKVKEAGNLPVQGNKREK